MLSGSNEIFAAPLVADPGTRYEYGINTDWLGRVVEAASGQSLDDYFAEHILGPLGMTSTAFLMSEEQRANSVPVAPARRGRRVGAVRTSTGRRSRSGGPAGTGCTRRRATT